MRKILAIVVLLFGTMAFAQNECSNAGYIPTPFGNAVDASGVNHQRLCVDTIGMFHFLNTSRSWLYHYVNGTFATLATANKWVTDVPFHIIRITEVSTNTPTCTVAPTLVLSDGTHTATINIGNAQSNDSGVVSVLLNAGTLTLSTTAGTCTTAPTNVNVNYEYISE